MAENYDNEIEAENTNLLGGNNPWLDELHPSTRTNGWYQKYTQCSLLYVERNLDVLVVSFDNLLDAGNNSPDRAPWGYKFFAKFGYSNLGIMVGSANWFRDQKLIDILEGLRDQGFFKKFKKVAFVGTSMGGFAAMVFSRLVPGCNVVAYSPQTSLDKKLVPWETRFLQGQNQNWNLAYSDAAIGLETANLVSIVYDPLNHLDNMQVKRVPHLPNIQHLLLPGCGHKTAVALKRLNSLASVQQTGIEGTLNAEDFRVIAKERRHIILYKTIMIGYLSLRKRSQIGKGFGDAFKGRRRKHLRNLQRMEAALES